jgi:hypothetical protein
VIPLICPECPDSGGTGLRHDPQDRNIFNCPRCLRSYVHSISRAWSAGSVNQAAPFYPLVVAIDAIFGASTRNKKVAA